MSVTLFNNRYAVGEELGRGGMGVVYRAHDQVLDRDVAVKLLNEVRLGTEGRVRLLHEAQAIANLNHPNIVQVHDAGELDGAPYIVSARSTPAARPRPSHQYQQASNDSGPLRVNRDAEVQNMAHRARLTLDEVAAAFGIEVADLGGHLERSVNEDGRLYAYAHLPRMAEVAPGDFIGAGIAMRASRAALEIHPYVVRQVSINGFVLAHLLDARPILFQDFTSLEAVKFAIGQVVRVGGAGEVFDFAVDRLRAARQVPAFSGSFAIDLSLMLNRALARQQLARILQRVSQEGDDSAFGLASGVTEIARDLVDPEDRWQLESLGGEIAVLAARKPALDPRPVYSVQVPVQAY